MSRKILIIALFASSVVFGQQDAQFNNITANPYILNPAAGGLTDVMQFEATGRTQWMGYNGGPRTLLFTGHSQITFDKNAPALEEYNLEDESFQSMPDITTGKIKHIVGGKVMNDAIGVFAKTSAYGSYAIHLPFTKRYNFGAGLGVGFSNFRVDESRVVLHQDDDMAYSQFLGNSGTQNFADVNAGLVFYDENLFIGLSASQILNNKVNLSGVGTESNYVRHYFAQIKYRINTSGSIDVEPNVLAKITNASPTSVDIGARFIYENRAWLNIQYRTGNALILQLGTTLVKNLYFSYGYEHSLGKIRSNGSGTHEINLGLYIGRNRNTNREIKENKKETENE